MELFLNETGSFLRVSMGKYFFWSDDVPVTGERREVIYERGAGYTMASGTGDVFYVGSIRLSSEFGEVLRCK